MSFSTEIIAAIGAAALLAAMAFRYLIDSVIKINNELQDSLADRHAVEEERVALMFRISELEARINAQEAEIQSLQLQLKSCNEQVQALQHVS